MCGMMIRNVALSPSRVAMYHLTSHHNFEYIAEVAVTSQVLDHELLTCHLVKVHNDQPTVLHRSASVAWMANCKCDTPVHR